LKVTTEAHVVEVLREEGPTKGMHIVKLAERVGMDPHFLREQCYPVLSRGNKPSC
jgi:hypothetical protein